MKSFAELDQAINNLKEVMTTCNDQKATYISNREQISSLLDDLNSDLKGALAANRRKNDDSDETVKQKAINLSKKLKTANQTLDQVASIKSELKEFTQDLLVEAFSDAQYSFFYYRRFRDDIKAQLITTKVNLATDITQLRTYLKDKKAGNNTLDAIDDFLLHLKQLDLYNTSQQDVDTLLASFSKATKHRLANTGRAAKAGIATKYQKPLEELLESAKNYTKESGHFWHKCHQLKDKLEENGGFVQSIRTAAGVSEFEQSLLVKSGKVTEKIRRLSERIKNYLPDGKGKDLLDKINGPSGNEKLLAFAKKYNIVKLMQYLHSGEGLNSIDFDGGGKVGQPEIEAKLPLQIKTPDDWKVEIPIPAFEYGVITGGFEIGAGVQASFSLAAVLKYTPFGDPILETAAEAKGELKAEVYFGVFLELLKLIKATGKVVLGASAGLGVSLKHELTRSLIQKFDHLALKGQTELKFELEGHVEFVLGLSSAVKIMLSAFQFNPELKFQSPKLVLIEASRAGDITVDIPLNGKLKGLPRNVLSLSDSGWNVTFVAKEAICDFIDETFGGLNKLESVLKENPLSQDQLDELTAQYGKIGSRA